MLEFGLYRITTTVGGSSDWWSDVRVLERREEECFVLILFYFILFLKAVGNGSKRIEPKVDKVSIFKAQIDNL